MRVLLINSVCGIGSTGRICTGIAETYEREGHEVKIAYGRDGTVPEQFRRFAVRIGTDLDVKLHGVYSRVLDKHGFASVSATKKFLKWAQAYDPDVLWLHNLHGYYINLELLFRWIKSRPEMQVKWTLHDCWAFTGHCPHFIVANCSKWKTVCGNCPQIKGYPASLGLDRSKENFLRKKELFTGVKNMTIITPSQWLENLVKQSFLREYPIEVHYNKIDAAVFKPTPSDFRERYGLENKIIILGAATAWGDGKGLPVFGKLSQMLDDRYKIVLVGLKEQQIKELPGKILGLPRTNNAVEMAQIYTAADVFLNPSRQETFGMTTVEALACGTPAIVYKGTACEEIAEKYGGVAVEQNADALLEAIKKMDLSEQTLPLADRE